MAWPPPTMPTTRTDTTVMATTHPAEHNAVNLAINDITTHINAGWSTWTPVLTGFGVSTTIARYKQIGKTVHFVYTGVLSSTSGVMFRVSAPVPIVAALTNQVFGAAIAVSTAVTHVGYVSSDGANAFYAGGAAGTTGASWTNAIPFTWAVGGVFRMFGTYETA